MYLQPLLDECCIASEPELQAILDEGNTGDLPFSFAQVGQTEELNQAKFESLFFMLGEEGETIEDFEARITADVEGLITDGDVTLANTGIEIPPISELCPLSTTSLHADTVAYERNLALQQTLGPWLDGQIDATCDANAQTVADLIASETIVRDAAIDVTNEELNRGLTILGESQVTGLTILEEDLATFGARMRNEFAAGPAVEQASGLPTFSEDCDAEDSADLAEATDIINEGLIFQAFNEFLNERFTTECATQESDMNALVDAAYLDQLESDQEAMVQHWYEVCDDCPEGETYDEFVKRNGLAFIASGVTFDSGIDVPEYPLDCLEYVESLEASQQALELYVQQLEFNLAFDEWATPQYEDLLERICMASSTDLGFQASGLEMAIFEEVTVSAPIIEEFLYNFDSDAEGLSESEYSAQAINS